MIIVQIVLWLYNALGNDYLSQMGLKYRWYGENYVFLFRFLNIKYTLFVGQISGKKARYQTKKDFADPVGTMYQLSDIFFMASLQHFVNIIQKKTALNVEYLLVLNLN